MTHKKKTVKSSSPGGMKLYFHAGTHDAIVRFQSETCDGERETIYVQEILPAFDKLVENLIFIQGFNVTHGNFDDLKNDCITFLFETLKKFDATRGTKAFSYFNVVAKNWLIVKSRQRAKAAKRMCSIDDKDAISEIDLIDLENYSVEQNQDANLIKEDTTTNIFVLLEDIRSDMTCENEIKCIEAIKKIFNEIDDVEILNKRAIFVYVRDITGLTPKQLSISMSSIRKRYKDLMVTGEYDIF
jgi:hypothetical protein